MRGLVLGLMLAAVPWASAFAAPWTFGPSIEVTQTQAKVFQHLDSSGRHNIAAGKQGVAIAWEDDRDGTPRVYLAYKAFNDQQFSSALRISGKGEAYEPSIVALGEARFAVAWEEDEQVHVRLVQTGDKPNRGPLLTVGKGSQANLVADNGKLMLLWSARDSRFGRITLQPINVDGKSLHADKSCPVDAVPPTDEQLYPSGVVLNGRVVVTWEDRRPKHTIIMASVENEPGACRFSNPVRISYKKAGRSIKYGAGHGVARVALARIDDKHVFAAWADKRDFRNGYDIWGAFYKEGGRFGKNQKVQDDFGGLAKQRHATVAGQNGSLVVAWDDNREGNTDIMLSWHMEDGWSDDWPIPDASGKGEQSHPSMVFDAQGNLHIVWVERDKIGGPTRLKYSMGRNNTK